MALAVAALVDREVSRIILTRPAVEAGEHLGFLPGDMQAKVDPYLRPLFDAVYDMLDADRLQTSMEKGLIEVAPLAFMRGRTLNDSFIILDEAQNTTPEQMQMFLTRLGFGSKIVVTGDVTQTDLKGGQRSGLVDVDGLLRGIPDIEFVYFGSEDVVRHKLVARIVSAYKARAEASNASAPGAERCARRPGARGRSRGRSRPGVCRAPGDRRARGSRAWRVSARSRSASSMTTPSAPSTATTAASTA